MRIRLLTTTFNEALTLPALAKGCAEMGIDDFVILDDEDSDDGTEEVAYREFGAVGIPGRVCKYHWPPDSALSDKRNALLHMPEAREGLTDDDYWFITQSDEPPTGPLDKSNLMSPVGLLTVQDMTEDEDKTHVSVPVEWSMPLLVRCDVRCHWEGLVHELLLFDQPIVADNLSSPRIRRYGSHATKEDREAQAAILEKELEETGAPRAAFYLGQTYQNLGRNEDAVAAYLHRASIKTHDGDQEQFCAMYRAGLILEQSDPFKACRAFMDAWTITPDRHEPLFHLANVMNRMGNHEAALMFCNQALMMPPSKASMFVERWIEQWGIRYQWSVAAWWCRIPECYSVMDELLSREDMPKMFRENIEANRLLPPLDEVEKNAGVKLNKPIGPRLDGTAAPAVRNPPAARKRSKSRRKHGR